MKIYFAGSIRGGRKEQETYLAIIGLLKKYGTVLTEHIGNKKLSERGEIRLSDKKIFDRDISLLDECDVIVAEVTAPSLGVGYEIGRMEKRKPILCLFHRANDIRLSAMILGNPGLQIEEYNGLSDIERILGNFFKAMG